jgi:hypothetical protein
MSDGLEARDHRFDAAENWSPWMKAWKLVAILALVYAGVVFAFEGILIGLIAGYFGFQPTEFEFSVVVLTTNAGDAPPIDRVLGRLDSDGQIYVAANHWPRAWYHRALANPNVQVTLDGEKADYLAVPVTGEEHDRLLTEHAMPVAARFVFGFPPRHFLRL